MGPLFEEGAIRDHRLVETIQAVGLGSPVRIKDPPSVEAMLVVDLESLAAVQEPHLVEALLVVDLVNRAAVRELLLVEVILAADLERPELAAPLLKIHLGGGLQIRCRLDLAMPAPVHHHFRVQVFLRFRKRVVEKTRSLSTRRLLMEPVRILTTLRPKWRRRNDY